MKIGIIIMGSGLSARFGSNKLLAEFRGKSLISLIVDKTSDLCAHAGSICAKDGDVKLCRLVLTRTGKVYDYCQACGVPAVLHELPTRNEAVALGMEQMMDCDACLFVGCDQPMLKPESIQRLIDEFVAGGSGIYRLSIAGAAGNPILFSKEYFGELMALPEKKGGAYLARKYPDQVRLVEAEDKWELFDVDTPEELELLSKVER